MVRDALSYCCIVVFLMASPFGVDVFLVCCTVVAADTGMCGESHGGGGGAVAVGGRDRRVQNQATPRHGIAQIFKRQRFLFSSLWIY